MRGYLRGEGGGQGGSGEGVRKWGDCDDLKLHPYNTAVYCGQLPPPPNNCGNLLLLLLFLLHL